MTTKPAILRKNWRSIYHVKSIGKNWTDKQQQNKTEKRAILWESESIHYMKIRAKRRGNENENKGKTIAAREKHDWKTYNNTAKQRHNMTLQRERRNTTWRLSKAVGTREQNMTENRQYCKKERQTKYDITMRTKHDLKTERSCRYTRAKHDRKQATQKQITTRTKTKRKQDKTWRQTMARYEIREHKIVAGLARAKPNR